MKDVFQSSEHGTHQVGRFRGLPLGNQLAAASLWRLPLLAAGCRIVSGRFELFPGRETKGIESSSY